MAASLHDVARLVGVSISTVSRALHRPEMVDPVTRARIEAAVQTLGYIPQGVGRALVSRRTRTVGAVVPQIGASGFAGTIEALRRALGQANYTLLLAQPPITEQSDMRPLRTLVERGVDGIVLLGSDYSDGLFDLVAKNGLPMTTIWSDSTYAQPGAIGFDNHAAGCIAVEHLLELGHRQFALITGALGSNLRARQRYQGILETLAGGGGRLQRDLIIEVDYGFGEGFRAARHLLGTGKAFTALICGNDYLALGAMACLRGEGVDMPGQMSVIGFNDSDFAAFVAPPLTTVHFPSADIGVAAAGVLLDVLEKKTPLPPPIILPTPLVVRESTGAAPAPA
ncbi:MAG: LacI family DNA-binding transcriptional regulator [Castellaniella sp.]